MKRLIPLTPHFPFFREVEKKKGEVEGKKIGNRKMPMCGICG